MTTDAAAPPRVLAVCTANISRSPAVERLLRHRLGADVEVGSAGVMALVGEPIDPPVAAFLTARGVSPDGFAARQVTPSLLRDADLVLTLTREHRASVLSLLPAGVRRTFTLLEFSRLVGSLDLTGAAGPTEPDGPGDRLRRLVPLAAAQRPFAPRVAGADDDVPDPFGRGREAYARSLALIEGATARLLAVLAG